MDELNGENHVLVQERPEVLINTLTNDLRAGKALLDQIPQLCLAAVENVVEGSVLLSSGERPGGNLGGLGSIADLLKISSSLGSVVS